MIAASAPAVKTAKSRPTLLVVQRSTHRAGKVEQGERCGGSSVPERPTPLAPLALETVGLPWAHLRPRRPVQTRMPPGRLVWCACAFARYTRAASVAPRLASPCIFYASCYRAAFPERECLIRRLIWQLETTALRVELPVVFGNATSCSFMSVMRMGTASVSGSSAPIGDRHLFSACLSMQPPSLVQDHDQTLHRNTERDRQGLCSSRTRPPMQHSKRLTLSRGTPAGLARTST